MEETPDAEGILTSLKKKKKSPSPVPIIKGLHLYVKKKIKMTDNPIA